jgi:hypothetical protein
MSATLRKPRNGLLLHDTFTRIVNVAPPSQKFSVCLPLFLPARRQELRSVWPLVSAGEVAVKRLLQIHPRVDTTLW